MSEVEVVQDLIELERLAEDEGDKERRQRLIEVAERVAARDGGVKASEAAAILGVSVPTVRAWIDAGVLQPLAGRSPLRVAVLSLAATKRAVDAIRQGNDDRHLLVEVLQMLRDRAVITGVDAREGLEDLVAGRVRMLDGAGLDELLPPNARSKPSKSR